MGAEIDSSGITEWQLLPFRVRAKDTERGARVVLTGTACLLAFPPGGGAGRGRGPGGAGTGMMRG